MEYIKADALPQNLLEELQKYASGKLIYVPIPETTRKKWGECTGSRSYIRERNAEIQDLFRKGMSISHLAERFHLSEDSIKKIVYNKKTL